MAEDLGARLVQAGLATRDQLAAVLGAAPPHEGALVVGLAERGVSEDALAGFFVAAGFGPLMEPRDLSGADPLAARRVPAEMALHLYALPIRLSPAGLVVAMAAPTDRHAVAELARAAGGEILPTVARPRELRRALRAAYPGGPPSDPPVPIESEPPVLELVQVRERGDRADAVHYLGSTRGAHRVEARAMVGPRLVDEPVDDDAPGLDGREGAEEDAFVPLVRQKPVAARRPFPDRRRVITKNFERVPAASEEDVVPVGARAGWAKGPTSDRPPAVAPGSSAAPQAVAPVPAAKGAAAPGPAAKAAAAKDAAAKGAAAKAAAAKDAAAKDAAAKDAAAKGAAAPGTPSAAGSSAGSRAQRSPAAPNPAAIAPLRAAPPPKSIIPPEHARWDLDEAPENKVDSKTLRRFVSSRTSRPPRPASIGGTLSAIRASRDRDEVVALACTAALTVARSSVLLALRKNVLKGVDGAGAGLSRDAVRNLWIPTSSPSMFRAVVADTEPYLGGWGRTAADGIFRAALGSRGGTVTIQPVTVGTKLVAALAADDLRFGSEGVERVEVLARAIGEAFERIIVGGKKR